jgi:hypothetical protein
MNQIIENYQKYKWFFTSTNKLVVGGKNSAQNDDLMKSILSSKKEFIIMHTHSPGSPFSVIISDISKVTDEDLKEAAIFTACFSKQWKSGKSKAEIDIFRTSQLAKAKNMKQGTWGVIGKVKTMVVPLTLVLAKQKSILRAVPEEATKDYLIKLVPGKMNKDEFALKLHLELKEKFSKEEILMAIPSGGFKISR